MGSDYIQSQIGRINAANKAQIMTETKKNVLEMLRKTIRPEFLNRIDETILFTPLSEDEIRQIVRLQLDNIKNMLKQQGIELEATDAAVDYLARVGYDPEFGARPVKRAIQEYVLNDLSKRLLADDVNRDKPITVDCQGDSLIFRN